MADEWSITKVIRLLLRIATVVCSILSGIKTATASQTMQDGSTVTSSDYPSFQYAKVSDLVSAVLQGVVICLELVEMKKFKLVGMKKFKLVVELIDKLAVALTSTSTALLFAVDEITSCGPGRRSVCSQAREFCSGIRQASHLSLAGTVSVASAVYIRRAPAALTLPGELFRRLTHMHPDDGPAIINRHGTRPDDPPPSPPHSWPPTPPPGPDPNPKNNHKPSSKEKEKHNLELLIIASPGPSHYPTGLGLRLSVSSHYEDEDEDAEAGWNDRFH